MGNPFVHVELNTDDVGKAKKFYLKLFDWKISTLSLGYTGFSLDEGFNVASLTRVNLGKDFYNNDIWAARVTFAAPMQSAAYSVCLTIRDTSRDDLMHLPTVYAKTAGYFDFVLRQQGSHFFDDPGNLAVGVDFQVFGRQDT